MPLKMAANENEIISNSTPQILYDDDRLQ